MPAPRPCLVEIEDLGLSHLKPWTHHELQEYHEARRERTRWVLVAKGSAKINRKGKQIIRKQNVNVEDPEINPDFVDVGDDPVGR